MNHGGAPVLIVASGYHAPLVIALPIIAAVVILKVVVSKARGRPALGGKIVVRCSKGHVFTTTWSPPRLAHVHPPRGRSVATLPSR